MVYSPAPSTLASFALAAPTHSSRVRLLSVAASLPDYVRTSEEVEALIAEASDGFKPRPGSIAAISGVQSRRVAPEHVQCSDLAADAACRALDKVGISPREIDVLIFAAAGQDLIEPATANIVQEKVGTRCQVFDVKNACNSFLNGLQLAESLILSGSCETALVTTGEICSRAIAWKAKNSKEFRRNFPGYTMGDAGAAAVLTRSLNGEGIYYRRFMSISCHWPLATVLSGGSMHPRGEDFAYLHADGARLKQAFIDLGPALIPGMLKEAGVDFDDINRVMVHQATAAYMEEMLEVTGIPGELVEVTVTDLGNMASASMPVAFCQAMERGTIKAGDQVMWLGLGSGISVGVMIMRV